MVRVYGWLQENRDLIAASEDPPEQGVDRRAVAGAIAWEAVENVKESMMLAVGLGKVHVRLPNWGIGYGKYKLESAAAEAEELGYVPERGYLERANVAATLSGGIEYIVAIMRAGADITWQLASSAIRRRPDILTTLYRGYSLDEWRKHIQEKLLKEAKGALTWTIEDEMARWVREHDLYLRMAVGEPGLPFEADSPARLLKMFADDALAKPYCKTGCNRFVEDVAAHYGINWVACLQANPMIDAMEERCPIVSADQARLLAEEGELVVAARRKEEHGHVAVVVPGPGRTEKNGAWYPNVEGTTLNGSTSAAFSDGSKTA